MKKHLLLTLSLIFGVILSVSAQDYWIEGFYERHGEGSYSLKNVHTQGIYLDGRTSLSETIFGKKENIICDNIGATMVQFSFEKATTDCSTKWKNGFDFQYWDDDNNKWKTDVEACKGQSTSYSTKDMVIMLILDYSYSMKDNIPRLQSSAINFINSVSAVSHGNVHIGIIAFSGMELARNQVFPITPISNSNKDAFVRFIRNSDKGKETALYYSMDKALGMMEDYVNLKNFDRDNYNGTCMITFTDGLDNASINDNISVSMHRGRKNEYLAYISRQLQGANRKYILGYPVESFAIGFTGSEDFTSEDLAFFREVLQQTTPDENHFKLATRFDEVEEYFKYITRQLTERWETITMYVGESQYGRVRWVLNCGEEKPEEPRQTRTPWFGFSGEIGALDGFFGGFNFDMAFSFNKVFALGARIGLMMGYYSREVYDQYWNGYYYEYYSHYEHGISAGILAGPEIKITFPNNSAILASLGGAYVNGEPVVYLGTGYKTKKGFFFGIDGMANGETAGVGARLGFSFGGKVK